MAEELELSWNFLKVQEVAGKIPSHPNSDLTADARNPRTDNPNPA